MKINLKIYNKKSRSQRGLMIVESAMAMVWFVAMFLFMLYMYEYIEANQEARVVSGVQFRDKLINEQYECYSVVEDAYHAEVGNRYSLQPLFNELSMPIDIKKVGFAGACPEPFQSRFDESEYRWTRTPEGAYIGEWL